MTEAGLFYACGFGVLLGNYPKEKGGQKKSLYSADQKIMIKPYKDLM